jgi:hypothetical protein
MTDRPHGRAVQPAWMLLCAALAAGLALWSLYLVGLVFLLVAAFSLGRAPESTRGRAATLLAMLVGFEGSMASLTALYWFAWGQRQSGFYVYLLVLAAMGAFILSLALWVNRKKAVHWYW